MNKSNNYALARVQTERQQQYGYNSIAIIRLVSGGQFSRNINRNYNVMEVFGEFVTEAELQAYADSHNLEITTMIQ